MGDVISFTDRKKAPPPSLTSLIETALVDIDSNWARFAKTNRLNNFFVQSVPMWAKQNVDYLTDLNELALIESKINMPAFSVGLQAAGWIAQHQLRDTIVCTPPMHTESASRAFNILLFLKLSRDVNLHGI